MKSKFNNSPELVQTFPVTFIPHKSGTFFADIYGPIENAAQFSDLISVLNSADSDCDIVINLSCPGGSLSATDSLIHAMRKTAANVHIVATGEVSSAGTFILLEAKSFELSEFFCSLIHCGSLGSVGNFNEYRKEVAFSSGYFERVLRTTYEGFLTDEEIDNMLDGKDFWLDARQWIERHEKRQEYFQNKLEEQLNPKKPKRTRKKITDPVE